MRLSLVLALASLALLGTGCELVVHFDRSKIDAGASSASALVAPDASVSPPADAGR